jgi:putative RecB family exonuclease
MFKTPRSFSYSSASLFKQCPRRWKHKYIDKLPDPTGEAALVGTFAHDVLEQLCEQEPALRTEAKAKEIAGKNWTKFAENTDFKKLELDEESQRAFRWKTWEAIQGLWHLEDPTKVAVEATEQKLSTSLSGVPFFGIVDRLDRNKDGLTVVDYKTGKVRNDNIDQVLLYSAAVTSQTGEQPSKARLFYLGNKEITPQIIETDVSEDLIDKVVEDLSDTWKKLNADLDSEEFEPMPTPLCGWCSFIEECTDGIEFIKKRASSGKLRSDAPARSALGL